MFLNKLYIIYKSKSDTGKKSNECLISFLRNNIIFYYFFHLSLNFCDYRIGGRHYVRALLDCLPACLVPYLYTTHSAIRHTIMCVTFGCFVVCWQPAFRRQNKCKTICELIYLFDVLFTCFIRCPKKIATL